VVDAMGHGVRSLMVVVTATGDASSPLRTRMGESGPDGQFTIAGLADGRYAVSAGDERAGFGRVDDVAAGASGVLVRLAPGGRVRAIVLHGDGSPAQSVFVSVRKVDGRATMAMPAGQTDLSGATEFAVPPGTLVLGAGDFDEDGTATASVSPGETATVEIRLAPRRPGPGTP
jgi:hypothetical protein